MKKCAYYSLIISDANKNTLTGVKQQKIIDELERSYKSLKKHNPNLEVIVFTNIDLSYLNLFERIEFYDFTMDHYNKHTIHKHYLHDRFDDYDTVMYIDCDTVVTKNIDYLFEKYKTGFSMAWFYDRFNTGIMFTDKETRKLLHKYISKNYIHFLNLDSHVNTYDAEELGLLKLLEYYKIKVTEIKQRTGDLILGVSSKYYPESAIIHYFSAFEKEFLLHHKEYKEN